MRLVILIVMIVMSAAVPAMADEQVNYVSQPDEITVFLNGVAYVRDVIRIASGTSAEIVLPTQIVQDTLVVRRGDARVPSYTIDRSSGQVVLEIATRTDNVDLDEITLEYLAYGISWKPLYTMELAEAEPEQVNLAFFAEVQNDAFTLDGVVLSLAAGSVDASQQLLSRDEVSQNQYMAGYDDSGMTVASVGTGAVTIQYLYTLPDVMSEPGQTLYAALLDTTLPARRVILWNASADLQATVIYKVKNDTDVPLAEGIVRSYQDGLFVGGDTIEFTPVGSEGSVTVGSVQDLRVNRAETTTYDDLAFSDADNIHEVTLTLSNFSAEAITLDVVDSYVPNAVEFSFAPDAAQEPGNLLRWTVTIGAGETETITYTYRSNY